MGVDPSRIQARHFETGAWMEITIEAGRIATIQPIEVSGPPRPDDLWIAPALWDIQTNGRWGISYSDPSIQPAQVAEIVLAQASLGTAKLCPTLITAPAESFKAGLQAIAAACDQNVAVASMILGIHLEGPYLSELDGYRGAHPLSAIRDPDWDEFQTFQEASGGRVIMMTLAPERPGSAPFIAKAVQSGVKIAIGHTSANGRQIQEAVDAGATLSTHLGNGIVSMLPRHPNPIWEQAARDELFASFIADGHHVDSSTLKTLVRAKTFDRVILVSDASPLAGLPVGDYGDWSVDPSGKIVVRGTPYLAGSNQGLETGLNVLMRAAGVGLAEAFATAATNPARFLGLDSPRLEEGASADLLLFHCDEKSEIRFAATLVRGRELWSTDITLSER